MVVTEAAIVRSRWSRRARYSTWRLRRVVTPWTRPERVSKAANRWVAPARQYSCSTWTGRPGWAGRVGARRGRGWSEVISSRLSTTACSSRRRVSRSATARTCAANVASRGVRGWSQAWDRQGFKRVAASSRWTVWGEIDATTPSRTSWRANSAQSHWLSERPACSGSSQARRTRCRATSGGERPGPTRPRTILQAGEAGLAIAVDPRADHVPPDAELAGDSIQRHPLGRPQDDPGAPDQPHRRRRPPRQRLKRHTAFLVQLDQPSAARPRHDSPQHEIRHDRPPAAASVNPSATSGERYLARLCPFHRQNKRGKVP